LPGFIVVQGGETERQLACFKNAITWDTRCLRNGSRRLETGSDPADHDDGTYRACRALRRLGALFRLSDLVGYKLCSKLQTLFSA
jgi:hypothetical protein